MLKDSRALSTGREVGGSGNGKQGARNQVQKHTSSLLKVLAQLMERQTSPKDLQESILSKRARGRLPLLDNRRQRSRLQNQINSPIPPPHGARAYDTPPAIRVPNSTMSHSSATEKRDTTSGAEREQCAQSPPTQGPHSTHLCNTGAWPRVWDHTVNDE